MTAAGNKTVFYGIGAERKVPVPLGVPRPVGPSYPGPAVHR